MPLKKIGTIKYSTTPRVLPSVNGSPRMEVSGITGSLGGNLLGTEVLQSMTTFSAVLKPDGHWQGECPDSGIVFVADGFATYSATGVGVNTEDGGSAWKGSYYFENSAPSL